MTVRSETPLVISIMLGEAASPDSETTDGIEAGGGEFQISATAIAGWCGERMR